MSDYDDIIKSIISGDIASLEVIAGVVDDFPGGKDHFISRHWITNAIDCGTAEVVAWMLNQGVTVVFDDSEGFSVLHSAIYRDTPDKYSILRMLITAGAEVNVHGAHDYTPAHLAAVRNDVEALKILKDAGADFSIRTRIDDYATPLKEAREVGGSADAVSYLEKNTEDITPEA